MNLKDKKVIVLGLGKSGIASCRLLSRLGASVIAFDEKDKNDLKDYVKDLPRDVIVKYGKIKSLPKGDLIVTSPGIPLDISYIKRAKDEGIPIIGEIELAFQMLEDQMVVAITGTNGKTTTTTIISKLLSDGGKDAITCGNIEIPFTSVIPNVKRDSIIVLEISSFQLETIVEFRPNVSLFLNFAPDHLDRYINIEDYMKAKARIFEKQKPSDIMVINADDPVVLNLSRRSRAKPYLFSTRQTLNEGVFIRDNWITSRFLHKEEKILNLSSIKLKGLHNVENILASILVGLILRLDISSIKKTIRNFSSLPHRIQEVLNIGGVVFVNDSKATNIASVIAALSSFKQPVILLAGGRDKGEDYTRLIPILKERVKTLILFGESADIIGSMVRDIIPIYKVLNLKQATDLSYALAEFNDCVLLSPSCSSFDQFSSYKERGEAFIKYVFALKDRLILNGRRRFARKC